MFSGDTGRHTRRNRSAAAPRSTPGHDAGQSIEGRHGPTTAPIATGPARAHMIQHRACEQTCPAPTARPATEGRGCPRPPRPTFSVAAREHLKSTQDHQKVCTSTPNPESPGQITRCLRVVLLEIHSCCIHYRSSTRMIRSILSAAGPSSCMRLEGASICVYHGCR